eukprot:SAG31_NODE_888_length_11219_cov_5.584712_9_plen_344_part_00
MLARARASLCTQPRLSKATAWPGAAPNSPSSLLHDLCHPGEITRGGCALPSSIIHPARVRLPALHFAVAGQDEVVGLAPACFDRKAESEAPFGVRADVPGTGPYTWDSEAVTQDSVHIGHLSLYYSGAGYLLNAAKWLRSPPTVLNPGSEFYPFPHLEVNTSDLWESGWIDKQTRAIFHDFTVYSSSLDMYANVRLTAEFETNAAVFSMSVNLRMFWLTRGIFHTAIDICFAIFLLLLVGGEIVELIKGYECAEKLIIERSVELKYRLRLRKLQFSAEHGLKDSYQPGRVLRKLTYRLYTVSSECVHHIKALNNIGKRIPMLESHYEDSRKMQKASGDRRALP